MQLTQHQTERARIEALKTYEEYGRVRELYRQDRSNSEISEHLQHLRSRYEQLEQQLGDQPDSLAIFGAPSAPLIDVENLLPPRTNSQSAFSQPPTEEPATTRVLRYGHMIRIAVSVVLIITAFSTLFLIANQDLGFYVVPSSSMEPTLLPNDRLIAYISQNYQRGDVVVVNAPDDPAGNLVKRIVGIPGDWVAIQNAGLVINGVPVSEPYLKETMDYKMDPVRVGHNEVFLLGDNRNQSQDSHIWKHGVPMTTIMGSVKTIYSPRTRLRAQIAYTEVFSDVDRKLERADRVTKAKPIS